MEQHSEKITESPAESIVESDVLLRFLATRRSVRLFKDEPLSREIIDRLIESALYAPSADKSVKRECTVVVNQAILEQLKHLTSDFYENILKLSKNEDFLNRLKMTMPEKYEMIKNEELLKKSTILTENLKRGIDTLFYHAPCLIVLHMLRTSILARENCCYALYNMLLMGLSMGIGSCINGLIINPINFDAKMKQMLKIPDENAAFAAAVFGYAESVNREIPQREKGQVTWI